MKEGTKDINLWDRRDCDNWDAQDYIGTLFNKLYCHMRGSKIVQLYKVCGFGIKEIWTICYFFCIALKTKGRKKCQSSVSLIYVLILLSLTYSLEQSVGCTA